MKIYKCLFFILFISFSNVLYSQILVPSDIDIFLNVVSRFNEIFNPDEEIYNYLEQYEEFGGNVSSIFENDGIIDNDIFNTLQMNLENLLEAKVPKKLELIFNEMGWNNNGHKKFWTIAICFGVFHNIEQYDMVLLKLFDKNDIKIIKERRDKLENLLG